MSQRPADPLGGPALASLMHGSDRVVIRKTASVGKSEMLPHLIRDPAAMLRLQHQRPRELPIIRR